MKKIVFYLDPEADGRNLKRLGSITQDGIYEGDQALKKEVEQTIERRRLNLHKPDDRLMLMRVFTGVKILATYEAE